MAHDRSPAGSPEPSVHLSTDLRLACLRIARRNRFESVIAVAPHQAAILTRIERGTTSAREIATLEKTSPATVSRTISGLVASGWVMRSGSPVDGRRIDLAITDEGRHVLVETRQAREEWMGSRLSQLSPEELDALEAALPVLEKLAIL